MNVKRKKFDPDEVVKGLSDSAFFSPPGTETEQGAEPPSSSSSEIAPSQESERAQTHSRTSAQSQDHTPTLPHNRDSAQSHSHDSAIAHKDGSVEVQQRERAISRTKRGYALRDDLVKSLKRVALDEDRKLYEVMEEAMEEYLARKRIRAQSQK